MGATPCRPRSSFSILERIDVGETTQTITSNYGAGPTFSILERIDVGETVYMPSLHAGQKAFSILERIDVGETFIGEKIGCRTVYFQYPRTDRRG